MSIQNCSDMSAKTKHLRLNYHLFNFDLNGNSKEFLKCKSLQIC